MKSASPSKAPPRRTYRQGARADAAARTGEAIISAFRNFLLSDWYDDISLDRVARAADVTVQTVLRHFGSKENMLAALAEALGGDIMEWRRVEPGDIDGAIAGVIEDYERSGEMVLRMLAQEERVPAIRTIVDMGRMGHRDWVRSSFAPWLDALDPDALEHRLDGLVVALDIYVWKVLRHDRGRSPAEVRGFMKSLVNGVLGISRPATQE